MTMLSYAKKISPFNLELSILLVKGLGNIQKY